MEATSEDQIMECIMDWETNYNRFLEAGGQPMGHDEREFQLMRIMTKELKIAAWISVSSQAGIAPMAPRLSSSII